MRWQTDGECCTFFYQHHVVLAVDQVLAYCWDLDMNLSLITQLLYHLNLAFQRDFRGATWQQMFWADPKDILAPT